MNTTYSKLYKFETQALAEDWLIKKNPQDVYDFYIIDEDKFYYNVIEDKKLIPQSGVGAVTVSENGVAKGNTENIDFIDGDNTTFDVVKDLITGKIKVKVNASGGGGIESIVEGTNITVDDTDPLNPIVSASSSLFPNGLSEETVSRQLTSDDIGKLLIIVNDGVILTPADDMAATGDLPKGFGIWCLNPTTKTSGFKVNTLSEIIYLETAGSSFGGGQIISFMVLYDDDLLTTNIFPLTDIMLPDEFTGTVGQLAIPYLLENLGFRGTATLFPNGVKVITESRTLQADDAGYVLMLESPDSETQVALTIPMPSVLNVGDNFGIIVDDGNDNANNGWIDGEGSPIRPFRGAITLFTTTSFEGNNVTIPVNSPPVEDGVNKSTVTRYLYDKVENRDFITKTKYEIDGLISTNALVKDATYKITGVHPTLYNDGTNSGTTILLKAISENVLETQGTGIFYNPKYNQSIDGFGIWDKKMYGTLSNIVTHPIDGEFRYGGEQVTADNGAIGRLLSDGIIEWVSGDWSTATSIIGTFTYATADISGFLSPTYNIGDKVIWGGYSWTNVNGNVGSAIDSLHLNNEWTKDVYGTENYNIAYDVIEYDYDNDLITRRYESQGDIDVKYTKNALDYFNINPISRQQFGNSYSYASALFLGQGHIKVNNAVNESINCLGTQIKMTFEMYSQHYLVSGKKSYQYDIHLGMYSQQSITLSYNSNQQNVYLSNSSIQSYLILGVNALQRNIRLENSQQVQLNLSSGASQKDVVLNYSTFNFASYKAIPIGFTISKLTINGVDYTHSNDFSSATLIYDETIIKEIYQRPDGTLKLKFMNNSDVLEVHGIAD